MLNRRIIRGKVLQQIFAYKMCEGANSELSKERIIEEFTPNLNSPDPQDHKKLEGYTKLTLLHFEEFLRSQKTDFESTLPLEIKTCLNKTILFFNNSNAADKIRILKKLVEDSEKLVDYYLLIIQIIYELADKLKDAKKDDSLSENQVIARLNKNSLLSQELIKRKLTWSVDQDIVSQLVINTSQDEEFKKYKTQHSDDFEEHRKIILYIVKTLIFKNPHLNDYFEDKNLSWEDDRVAVKDMVVDSIKAITPETDFIIATISKNWEDDKLFMKELYNNTLEGEKEYEGMIAPKLKNWDISRLTSTDDIIMKMCIGEMIHFKNVPLKVSLNEYIELSKRFSTPKSKTLINGVLDNLSQELVSTGVIKKTGRGLIDNK